MTDRKGRASHKSEENRGSTEKSTVSETPPSSDGKDESAPQRFLALVVLWAEKEPHRIGEVILLPTGEPGPGQIFGRRGGARHDSEERVQLFRQRPGVPQPRGQIEADRISREQLWLRAMGPDTIELENRGKCPLFLNGEEITSGNAKDGDVLEIGYQITLLCTFRPKALSHKEPRPSTNFDFGRPDEYGIVGESPAIWELRRRIAYVGPRAGHVLILGESGTGKELIANAIHKSSPVASKDMISHNAAGIPESLAAVELFGNKKNYPNPTMPARLGLVGKAAGTTLFLDEFGDLPMTAQAAMLRALDPGRFTPLGEEEERPSMFRLVAATNKPVTDIKYDVLARFEHVITAPGLNERREDIPLLAIHLLRQESKKDHQFISNRFMVGSGDNVVPRLTPALVRALTCHMYEKNVRELKKLLLDSAYSSEGDRLDLCAELILGIAAGVKSSPERSANDIAAWTAARAAESEAARIQSALDASKGNVTRAASLLGLTREEFRTKMRNFGFHIERKVTRR